MKNDKNEALVSATKLVLLEMGRRKEPKPKAGTFLGDSLRAFTEFDAQVSAERLKIRKELWDLIAKA